MDIEQIFAAAVFSAEKEAAEARKEGIPYTASDVIEEARSDLWSVGYAQGHKRDDIQAIADRYVVWDEQDRPWPRKDIDLGNVVPIGEKR
jgi:hypothetical protein